MAYLGIKGGFLEIPLMAQASSFFSLSSTPELAGSLWTIWDSTPACLAWILGEASCRLALELCLTRSTYYNGELFEPDTVFSLLSLRGRVRAQFITTEGPSVTYPGSHGYPLIC